MTKFAWDESKNLTNQTKHNVSFSEAYSVFYDEHARLIADPEHSADEDRFILLGISLNARLLVVVHTYNETDDEIRIISARKATKSELKFYTGELK